MTYYCNTSSCVIYNSNQNCLYCNKIFHKIRDIDNKVKAINEEIEYYASRLDFVWITNNHEYKVIHSLYSNSLDRRIILKACQQKRQKINKTL